MFEYTGLNMLEIEGLDYIDYYKQSQTEHGREYLENAYRLEQTTPDREGLRRFKKGGGNG